MTAILRFIESPLSCESPQKNYRLLFAERVFLNHDQLIIKEHLI